MDPILAANARNTVALAISSQIAEDFAAMFGMDLRGNWRESTGTLSLPAQTAHEYCLSRVVHRSDFHLTGVIDECEAKTVKAEVRAGNGSPWQEYLLSSEEEQALLMQINRLSEFRCPAARLSEWTSVDTSIPGGGPEDATYDTEDMLVTDGTGVFVAKARYVDGSFTFWHDASSGVVVEGVTHWMPLPVLPGEE